MKKRIIYFSFFIFHFSFIQAQSWLWSANGIGDGFTFSVASDINGNCYLFGGLQDDTIHFGSYTLMNSNTSTLDMFLIKYSHNGNLQWAKQSINLGPGASFSNSNVTTDIWGNAYIASDFSDTLIIGTYTLVTSKWDDSYVVKYDPAGNIKWIERSTHSTSNREVIGDEYISCDIHANVYLSGSFSDTVNFGSYKIIGTSPMDYSNSLLVKYDSIGNVKWAKQSEYVGANSSDASVCNASDRFGNSFLTGWFQDTISFGLCQLHGGNNANFYLVKYDSNGNVLWAKQDSELHGGSSNGVSVVTDQEGNIYTAVQFDGTILFGEDTLVSPPGKSCFCIVKYDPNGNILWAKKASVLDNNNWTIWSLSIDNAKHLYFSADGGYQTCEIAFGGDTLSMYDTAAFDGASVIFKLDSNGNALCSAITPVGSIVNSSNAIASDTSGNYVYFGASAATIGIFGQDTVNPFSIPPNPILQENYFPIAARWEECNPNVITAGVQNVKPSGQVGLYPNPNNGSFTLALQNVNGPAQVEIYNMLGESIYKTTLNPTNTVLSLSGQPNGLYFYRVITESGGLVGSGKVILQK